MSLSITLVSIITLTIGLFVVLASIILHDSINRMFQFRIAPMVFGIIGLLVFFFGKYIWYILDFVNNAPVLSYSDYVMDQSLWEINKYANLGELYNAFKLGKIDLITTTNTKIEDYIGTIGYNIQEVAGREYDFLAINTQNAVLSKKEVRQAILHAINRENIVATIYNNKYKITNYPLDYGNWLKGESTADNNYNLDSSKQILEQNGWIFKNNKWQKTENYVTRTISFRLVVQASNTTRVTIAEMIKKNLAEIGIQVTIVKASDSQYRNYLQNKNYDVILTGTTESMSPNLETFFGESNLSNYKNEETAIFHRYGKTYETNFSTKIRI